MSTEHKLFVREFYEENKRGHINQEFKVWCETCGFADSVGYRSGVEELERRHRQFAIEQALGLIFDEEWLDRVNQGEV